MIGIVINQFCMKRKAFTLIELLIVIAIIGVLAAALYPTIRDALSRGRDAAREGDINNIITALETYNSDYGTYPPYAGCVDGSTTGVFRDPDDTENVAMTYFKSLKPPVDPSPNRSLPSGLSDAAALCIQDGFYYYEYIGANGLEYLVSTIMETEKNNNTDTSPVGYDGSSAMTEGDTWYIKVL